MRTEVRKIDPLKAAELLASVTHNRPIAAAIVARYARAMTDGRWRLNGQGISVIQNGDGTEHMINGSHRMAAVVRSGVTQEFLVVFEEDEHVFVTFDTGRIRSTSVMLGLIGQSNPAVVAAISRMLLLYQTYPNDLWNKSDMTAGDQVIAWYESHDADDLSEAGRLVGEMRRYVRTTGSWYGALTWLIREESAQPDLLIPFHEAVKHGAGLPEGDPRLAFRNYVINSTLARGSAGDIARQGALTVGIRAWNDWLDGSSQIHYQFRVGRMLNGKRVQSSLPMPEVK